MICPDCEMEVTSLSTKGVCKQCSVRINQNTYLNKRDGTNKPYVPLKELKITNPTAYNRVMGRRALSQKQTPAKKTKTETKEVKKEAKEDLRTIYYSKVAKDIESAFKEAKLTQDYLNHKNLDSWIETFFLMLQEDNFISDAVKGEQIFNKINLLYKHSKENLDWDNIDKINDISYAEKALSELRRPTKELLDYYNVIMPVVDYLKNDKEFMKLLEDSRLTMLQKSKNHENPGYYAEVESSIVPTDYILGIANNKTKIYDCTVWCYNLNGDPNRRLFRANGGIFAKNEVEAKLRFKNFLKDKFATVTYKDKDISIKEVSSQEEIRKLVNKEGL